MYERICDIPLFAGLTDEQIIWLEENSSEIEVEAGECILAENEPANAFFVILEGEMRITKDMGDDEAVLATHSPGNFSGELSLLTGSPHTATVKAVRPSRLLRIEAETFHEMLRVCSPVATVILPTMAERIKETDATLRQREKMAALGKLSAGLAHELNNPAAAARRASGQLRESFQTLQSYLVRLNQQPPEKLDWLTQLQQELIERVRTSPPMDALAQSDREDELNTWIENHNVEEAWRLAPTLASAGVDTDTLDAVEANIGNDCLCEALNWLDSSLTVYNLLHEVEQSTSRISELVSAIKSYSYMDQAPLQEIDIHDGIENTLVILRHKLKDGITIKREYDRSLPKISAYGSELNQVWTNLLDNAIDAMNGHGTISIRTLRDDDHVQVEISDTGSGIPPEIQTRIFEPFFTTKGVGKGTGLGLDIAYRTVVRRHHGDIKVTSKPGDTRFTIRLPIRQG